VENSANSVKYPHPAYVGPVLHGSFAVIETRQNEPLG
jgi:hypothetical protein